MKKPSNIGFLLIAVFVIASKASASDSLSNVQLNALSESYDVKTRTEYSNNDVISFVYSWFAAFDHQKRAGYFLNRIASPVDMQYPDFPIKSQQDFLVWYKGVTDNIIWNRHELNNLKITGDQNTGWEVSYLVRWKAKDKAGKEYDMNVQQTLNIIRYGDMLKISRLRAEVTK